MSFGRPGAFKDTFKPSPPQRGSFPLDHEGECKEAMMKYVRCIKLNQSNNGKCRLESRGYLECRMDKGLMTRDDMGNLGLGDVGPPGTPIHVPKPPPNTDDPIPSAALDSAPAAPPIPLPQSNVSTREGNTSIRR